MGGSLETGKGGGDDLFARKVFSLSGRGGGEVSKQDGGRIGRECGVGSGGVECVFFVWEGLGEGGLIGFTSWCNGRTGIPA